MCDQCAYTALLDRAGLEINANYPAHPHFYCKSRGQLDCLTPERLSINSDNLLKTEKRK